MRHRARAPVPLRSSVTGAFWIRRGSNPPISRSDPLRPDSRISYSIEARRNTIPAMGAHHIALTGYRTAINRHIVPPRGTIAVKGVRSSHFFELHDRRRNTPSMANHVLAMLSKIVLLAELIPTMTASLSEPSGRATAYDAVPNSFPRRAPRVRPVPAFELN